MERQYPASRAAYRVSLSVSLLILSLLFATGCGRKDEDQPLFFAAASLADVLTEVEQVYEQQTGKSVLFSFGGSNTLTNQIVTLDAPADGVVLAGQVPMQRLVDVGKVVPGKLHVVARNSLVIVSSKQAALADLQEIASQGGKVAIADPDLAPAGQYAREALEAAGIWDALQGRIVPTLDVRAALAAVSSGSVAYAIVYATDAMSEPSLKVLLQMEEHLHSPVEYPAAPINGSKNSEAADDFIQFLRSPGAAPIFQQYGFTSP